MGWCEYDGLKQQTFNHISLHALVAQIWCGETNEALACPSPHAADTEAKQHHMLLDCAQVGGIRSLGTTQGSGCSAVGLSR